MITIDRRQRSAAWRERILIAALALLALAALYVRSDLLEPSHPDFARPWDHHKYIHMAEGGAFHYRVAPFCWRVGLPLMVRALPLSIRDGFLFLTLMSLWAAGLLLYHTARSLEFSPRLSSAGMLLFYSLGWAVKYNLIHFWLSDAAAFAMVGAVIFLILRRRMAWAALALALGVTVKESVIFAAPLLYTLRARRAWDFDLLRSSLLTTLPALILLAALRVAVPIGNGDPSYLATLPEALRTVHHGVSDFDLGYLWREHGLRRLSAPTLFDLKEISIWSWGPLVLLVPFFPLARPRAIFIRMAPLLLLAYAQLLLASNSQRLVVLASPAMILPGLAVLKRWGHWLRAGESSWLLLASGLLILDLLDPTASSAPFPMQLAYVSSFMMILLAGRPFRAFEGAARAGP